MKKDKAELVDIILQQELRIAGFKKDIIAIKRVVDKYHNIVEGR